MITLFRWIILQQKKIKWELALWQFIDQQASELLKNPEELERLQHAYEVREKRRAARRR